MDTSETYIKMSDCPEIQDTQKRHDTGSVLANALILDNMSYYAIRQELGEFYYVSGFANSYTSNGTVGGYVLIPERRFGCAVRDDLPIAYKWDEILWLPRQDELQKMVLMFDDVLNHPRLQRALFFILDQHYVGSPFKTMEQLWLAFVMKEKYGKVWNNGNWEVE